MIYLGKDQVGINKEINTNPFFKITQLTNNWGYAIFDINEDVVIDCSDIYWIDYNGIKQCPYADQAFYNARNLRSITLYNLYTNNKINMGSFATKDGYFGSYQDNLTTISFDNKIIIPNTCAGAFQGRTKLTTINAIFDLSQVATYSGGYNFRSMFNECTALEEIRFVPNSILWMNYQLFNVSQVLSDASLISIANGLAEGATNYNTITLLSTPKARCSTLMGNVDNNNLFVANVNGTTSLAAFITNIKGWTLN